MKTPAAYLIASALIAIPCTSPHAQELQLHYDFRHTTDPRRNATNFPSLTFKTYKGLDYGSFLLKMEGDLNGTRGNLSKVYVEVTQDLKFWNAPYLLHLEYTGGLGLFNGGEGGYYLENAYLLGATHPFPLGGSWGSVFVAYKRTNFPHASHDPAVSLYWGKAFPGGLTFASTAVTWTQNRNHGDAFTAGEGGKRVSSLIESEFWYRVVPQLSLGSLIRLSYNVYSTDGRILLYPTAGIRYAF